MAYLTYLKLNFMKLIIQDCIYAKLTQVFLNSLDENHV